MNFGSRLVFNSGNMIAGLTSGASVASSYYTTQMPTMTAYNMMKRFSDSATPAVNELWGRRDVEKLRNALLRITRLLMTLTLPLAVGALLFNRDLGRPGLADADMQALDRQRHWPVSASSLLFSEWQSIIPLSLAGCGC